VTRVYVVVEGATEESFLNTVVAPALWTWGVNVIPIIVGAPGHKGGKPKYSRVKKDVVKLLKEDQYAYCSTMLDLYGLGTDFPGMPVDENLRSLEKAVTIEEAVKHAIVAEHPDLRPDLRFLPYIQLYEYEGLLFSDPTAFATGIGQESLRQQFQLIRDQFPTPEDINDNPNSAPSKRVLRVHSSYQKVLDGTLAAQAVGLQRMRRECPHFCQWIEWLELLAPRPRNFAAE